MNLFYSIRPLKLKFLLYPLLILIFYHNQGVCQSFNRLEVSDLPVFLKPVDPGKLVANHLTKQNPVKVVDFLPKNYSKDGSVDYTKRIQKILDENRSIVFPAFPILINDLGLTIHDGTTLVFPVGSSLLLAPSAKGKYEMLRIHGKNNITIINPTLVGERANHKGSSGEWGMGISIKDAENVKIINPTIRDCWGDGIYLGRTTKVNKNIKISGGVIDNSRRNGISIISVNGLVIENIVVSNTNGVSPQVGIDFEPNRASDILQDIVIQNTYLFNNKFTGLFFNTTKVISSGNSIDVRVVNVLNERSLYAVGYSSPKKAPKNSRGLGGKIEIDNLVNKNTSEGLKIFGTSNLDKVNISVDKQILKK